MRKTKLFILCICIYASIFFGIKNVFAEKVPTKISITPVVERIHLVQNSETEEKFQVKNNSDQELKFKVYTSPYTVKDGENEIDLESETKYTTIRDWISFRTQDGTYKNTSIYSLSAGESLEINYKITVPAEVATGGQYAVIFAEAVSDDESVGIKNQSRVALKVQGIFDDLQKFGAEIGELKASGFLLGSKLSLQTEVKNTGNIDISVGVRTSLSSLSGETIFEKDYATSIYPEATKKLKYTFDETPSLGIYKFHALISAAGEQKEADKIIIIVPTYIVVFIIVAGIIIIYIIYHRISLRRAKNARQKIKNS